VRIRVGSTNVLSALKVVEVSRLCHTSRVRKDFSSGNNRGVGTGLAAHSKNRTVGKNKSSGIPARIKESQLRVVLFPDIGAIVDSPGRIRSEEANTVNRLGRPSADVDDTTGLIGESERSRAEDIGLESEFTIDVGGVVKLERALSVIIRCTVLLDKNNLVVDADRADKGNDRRSGKVVVSSSLVTRCVMEGVERRASPLVVVNVVSSTACKIAITRAGHAAETVILPDITPGLDGFEITADTLATVLNTAGGVAELLAAGKAGLDGHVASSIAAGVLIKPLKKVGVVVIKDTALVLPVTRKVIHLGNRDWVDLEVSFGVER
jgi:hypothetical protein